MRLTFQSLKILRELLGHEEVYGAAVSRATNISTGVLYPILARFEAAGWVRSHWERGSAHQLQRPLRRFYSLTAKGVAAAEHALRELT